MVRDQRIAEQSSDIEKLKNITDNNDGNPANEYKKTAAIKILRSTAPDFVVSKVRQIKFCTFFCVFCNLFII